jgi:hypothetical protein
MMRFVADAFGIEWTSEGRGPVTLNCSRHTLWHGLALARHSAATKIKGMGLSVQFIAEDPIPDDLTWLANEWSHRGLGEFRKPSGTPKSILTNMQDYLALRIEVPVEALADLKMELRSHASASEPKYIWGQFLDDFQLDAVTPVFGGDEAKESAFLEDLLPAFARRPPRLYFCAGSEMPSIGDLGIPD